MTPPLAVLQLVERMDAKMRDWGERPNHWIVRFADGRAFQISKSDPLITKEISGKQPKVAAGQRRRAN